jgi:hypothetical protein
MNWNQLFSYDEATGSIIWKPRIGTPKMVAAFNRRFAGKIAGTKAYAKAGKAGSPRGITVTVRGLGLRGEYAHRIVWEMGNGPIPEGMVIDHINGNAFDNRLSNLRLATHAQNLQNMRTRPASKSQLKGVRFDKARGLWSAELRANGQRYRLGRFATKGLAAVARAKAAIRYHGEFARFA